MLATIVAGVLARHARAPGDVRRERRRWRWCASSASNRRRYGGYIVHVGIVIYFVAFTGTGVPSETSSRRSKPGETTEMRVAYG